ncbi:MAG TPA: RHS repeat-associated core domain-containing protein [Saprospiraceae bacterium]|nr:RHS repeat-associated core domain-containing protein [Saprospiraceae bacterium]
MQKNRRIPIFNPSPGKDPAFGLLHYDYGFRIYHPGLGRFLSVDPLADEYPSISPYAYVANNPINAIDPDGRDYILLIDHNTQTVTVKAVFYTQTGDATSNTSAQQAATFWNNNSGNFSYKVGRGKSAQSYTVNFDVQVQSVANPRAEASKDKAAHIPASSKTTSDGSSNAYEVKPNTDKDFTGKNSQRNGVTKGGNLVLVKQSRASSDTGAHEVGHALGVDHSSTGIMTAASNDPNRIKAMCGELSKMPLSLRREKLLEIFKKQVLHLTSLEKER